MIGTDNLPYANYTDGTTANLWIFSKTRSIKVKGVPYSNLLKFRSKGFD